MASEQINFKEMGHKQKGFRQIGPAKMYALGNGFLLSTFKFAQPILIALQ